MIVSDFITPESLYLDELSRLLPVEAGIVVNLDEVER